MAPWAIMVTLQQKVTEWKPLSLPWVIPSGRNSIPQRHRHQWEHVKQISNVLLWWTSFLKVNQLISPFHSGPKAFCFFTQMRNMPFFSPQDIDIGREWHGIRKDQQLLLVSLQDQLVKAAIWTGLRLNCNHWLQTHIIRKAAGKGVFFLTHEYLGQGLLF